MSQPEPTAPLAASPMAARARHLTSDAPSAGFVAAANLLIGLTATEALIEDTATALLLVLAGVLLFAGGALIRTPRGAPDQPRRRFGRKTGWLTLLAGLATCYVVARAGEPWAPMSGSGPEFMVPLAGGFLLVVLLIVARIVDRWALPAALMAGLSHGVIVLVGFGLASQFAWLAQAELRGTAVRCAEIVGLYAVGAVLWERAAAWPRQIGRIASLALLSAAFVWTLVWSSLREEPLPGIAAAFAILGLLNVPLLLRHPRGLIDARRPQDTAGWNMTMLGILLATALAATLGSNRLSWLGGPVVLAIFSCYGYTRGWRAPRRDAVAPGT